MHPGILFDILNTTKRGIDLSEYVLTFISPDSKAETALFEVVASARSFRDRWETMKKDPD